MLLLVLVIDEHEQEHDYEHEKMRSSKIGATMNDPNRYWHLSQKPNMKRINIRYFTIVACLAAVHGFAQKQKSSSPSRPAKSETSFTLPDTVSIEKDIVYARYGSREVMLDMYLPKQRSAIPRNAGSGTTRPRG